METAQIELLKQARHLIADEKHWCQNNFATTPAGVVDTVESPLSTKFCASGALRRVSWLQWGLRQSNDEVEVERVVNDKATELYQDRWREIQGVDGGCVGPCCNLSSYDLPIAWVNDQVGHEAIIEIFDKVLADNGGLL